MKFVQKLGKALMLPVACLPICGILMGLGYAMCPSTMQGGDVTGVVEQIGFFLVKAWWCLDRPYGTPLCNRCWCWYV